MAGRLFCVLLFLAGAQADVVVLPQAVIDGSALPEGLNNADFERGGEGWSGWMAGFESLGQGGRNGTQGVRCAAENTDQQHGVMQLVMLNQAVPRPVVVTGWSRAEAVDGMSDNGYSIYLDVNFQDGGHLWGQTACFSVGSHDWEKRRFLLAPEKAIQSLSVIGLFRGHNGTVYFDDFSCMQMGEGQGIFEGVPVGELNRIAGAEGPKMHVEAGGLGLSVDQGSGGLSALSLNGASLGEGGVPIFVRDVGSDGGFVAPAWTVASNPGGVTLTGESLLLQLSLSVSITARDGMIDFAGTVRDRSGVDRTVTVYIPLPVSGAWRWWQDMRRDLPAQGLCMNAFRTGVGATGLRSSYPLSVLTGERGGLTLATPIDEPRHHRLVYDAERGLFFAAFDFGLSADTKRSPGAASFHAMLFSSPAAEGFRGALQRYYGIFPAAFEKRVPREGLWMAFTDISTLPQAEDFGFAFQEGGSNIAWDEAHGILSFPYTEPMTTWLKLAPEVPRTYDGAVQYLHGLMQKPEDPMHDSAQVIALSSVHDGDGKSILSVVNAPWCDGCVFALNADPTLPMTAACPVNRGQSEIRRFEKEVTESKDGAYADGAYIDSYEFWANSLDYRREHWAGTEIPLVFDAQTRRAGMLTVFSTFAFQRELAKSMHGRGKFMMANGVFAQYDIPAAYLDVLGTETNWMPGGVWQPMSDAELCFRRALSFQKPYCFLMNTHYADFTLELTERYMQRALAYGMFPGFFSENASTDCYFANPKYYEPARPLFKKYLPLIQTIAKAGWQPVTHATTDDHSVYVERFGTPESGTVYFTLLNDSKESRTVHCAVDCAGLGWSPESIVLRELIADQVWHWEQPGTCVVNLAPEQAALLRVGVAVQ